MPHSMLLAVLAAAAVDAPITDVTVFSDRARVVRTASLSVAGTQTVELCTLLDTADLGTIRVEAEGAVVQRVDTPRISDDELPVSEARALLTDLEKVDDRLAKLGADRQALASQEAALKKLQPQVPQGDPLKAPLKLSPAGWKASIDFTTQALDKVQAKQRELEAALQTEHDARELLVQKATELGGARRRAGYKVMATLAGSGAAKVFVTYFVAGAKWSPSYDVQLQPETQKVVLAFSGLVTQTSGEDWNDAQLQLSTAIPSNSTAFPKFSTWKIGLRERFIPTATPMRDVQRPAPVAPPLPVPQKEVERLRARLDALLTQDQSVAREQPVQFAQDEIAGKLTKPEGRNRHSKKSMEAKPAREPADVDRDGVADVVDERRDYAESVSITSAAPAAAIGNFFSQLGRSEPARTVPFSLSPPPAWQPPPLPPDSAAAAAGGYDLTWPSLQRETVPSNSGARRVALFAQTWPVKTERKVFPALFSEAFLVAELKNPSPTPLPAGVANLAVGDDPAGMATLSLVSPGQTFTLPLGIDRAIRPVRNVKVIDSEKGVLMKDDLSEYTVTIELANPYRTPLSITVADQYPLTTSNDVEVKLLESKPVATVDAIRGGLEWKVTVPAGQKSVVSYRYSVRRPKGWQMQQWEEAR